MKIQCRCGEWIHDSSDSLYNKAHFVGDQDWEDLCEGLGHAPTPQGVVEILGRYGRRCLRECGHCGRLYVDGLDFAAHSYAPEDAQRGLLQSHLGEKWKRFLRGHFRSGRTPPGELYWGSGQTDSGFHQFDDWLTLEKNYFEVFERLRKGDLLRDAFLDRDGQRVHDWPDPR